MFNDKLIDFLSCSVAAVSALKCFSLGPLQLNVYEHISFEELKNGLKGWQGLIFSRIELLQLFKTPLVDVIFRMSIILQFSIIASMDNNRDAV